MAVVTFDEMYSQLSADEKKVFDSAIAKNPELKDGWLRRDDYSRKTAELATERKKFESDLDYAQRMKVWAEDAVPRYDALKAAGIIDDDGNELWTTQKTKYEEDLKAARAAAVGGEDMKPEELEKRVRDIIKDAGGSLTREEIKALYEAEGRKTAKAVYEEEWKAKEADFNTKTIPFVSGFSAGVAVVASRYERETGEKWTVDKQKELFDMMSAKNNFDPFALEEDLLKPYKAKKAEDERVEARARELAKTMRSGMPGEGDGEFFPSPGPESKGALQLALDRSGEGGDFESMIKARAVEGAKALQSEGKG